MGPRKNRQMDHQREIAALLPYIIVVELPEPLTRPASSVTEERISFVVSMLDCRSISRTTVLYYPSARAVSSAAFSNLLPLVGQN